MRVISEKQAKDLSTEYHICVENIGGDGFEFMGVKLPKNCCVYKNGTDYVVVDYDLEAE